jgi:Bacterial surface proteins containing Ig-like domains
MVWNSSNTEAVTVNNSGEVSAVNTGESLITVQIGNSKAICKVIVNEKPVEKISLNEQEVTIEVKKEFQLVATIEPSDATNKTITWDSENKNVATVDNNGLVKALAVGESNITAKIGDIVASCHVIVKPEQAKFEISVTNITATNADVNIKITNQEQKYYYYILTKTRYDEICADERYQDDVHPVVAFDKAFAKAIAGMYGTTWQEEFALMLTAGDKALKLNETISLGRHETDYIVYAYAVDNEMNVSSEFTTKEFKTSKPKPSNNTITATIEAIHTNGVTANFTVTNPNEEYFITLQPESFVLSYDENPEVDDNDMAYAVLEAVKVNSGYIPLHKGNTTIEPGPGYMAKPGSKYYILYFAFDYENGIRSEIYRMPFTTNY